jgi:hypothetical protein
LNESANESGIKKFYARKPLGGRIMNNIFIFDDRLGIHLPNLERDWEEYSTEEQEQILFQWEKIRGKIPDRIAELEKEINKKQAELGEEFDFNRSCLLNSEIADLASIINDLWIWYRMHGNVTKMIHM